MVNRVIAIASLLSIWICGTAFCLESAESSAPGLPVYPGCEPTLEMDLGSDELAAALDFALPMLAGKYNLPADLKPEDVAVIFADVRRIQALQVEVDKPKTTESDVAAFYADRLPEGTWSRVFWQNQGSGGIAALYMRSGGDGIYGFRIDTKKSGNMQMPRALVILAEGRLDIARLLALGAKVFGPTSGVLP